MDFPNLQQTVAQFTDWALDNRESLTLLLAALVVFSPWGLIRFIHSRQRNAPEITLGLVRVDDLLGDESSFVINVTNVGGSAAKKVRTEWHPESSCDLRPPAQPFTLLPDATQPCEFVVRPIDAILRIGRPAAERRLGSFAVTYGGGWRRRRVGASLVMVEHATGHAQNAIDLISLPRKRLRDAVPIIGRMADVRAAQKHEQRVTEHLAWARSYLAEHAISVEQQGPDDDVFRRLLGELQHRGWELDDESHGSGYTIKMTKTWWPSSSQTFRIYTDTREDAAMLALARAIQCEAERSGMNGDALAA